VRRAWYACFFALAVLALGAGGLFAFRGLDSMIANAARVARAKEVAWPQDSVSVSRPFVPIAPDADEYARFEAEDAAWRERNARQFTLSELRARGDGRRTAQDSLHDRVYEYTRIGDRARAIAELERWIARNRGDEQALLSLARLLNETGRNEDAITRYRELLALMERSGGG
jgi:tetratricopeptide (TPR) repeat protein